MFVSSSTRAVAKMAFVARLHIGVTATASLGRWHNVTSLKTSESPASLTNRRGHSSAAAPADNDFDPMGPQGDLFGSHVGPSLVGKTAKVRRIFGARANSIGLLTAGGEALAKHASFDPEYNRARDWIRQHAVGPAVLSPVLISGLVGALVEAACPHSIQMSSSMQQIRPLIVGVSDCQLVPVGVDTVVVCVLCKLELIMSFSRYIAQVEVCAKIEVVAVIDSSTTESQNRTSDRGDLFERKNGYEVHLKTSVNRVRDDNEVAVGTHVIWIPDYMHM
jgi:hypothetical protein